MPTFQERSADQLHYQHVTRQWSCHKNKDKDKGIDNENDKDKISYRVFLYDPPIGIKWKNIEKFIMALG